VCETTDRREDSPLARYLRHRQTAVDNSTTKVFEYGVTVGDLLAVAAYLRVLNENAYQLAVLTVNAVLVADPKYRAQAGPTGLTVFGSLDHVMKLYEANGSFIECAERELRRLNQRDSEATTEVPDRPALPIAECEPWRYHHTTSDRRHSRRAQEGDDKAHDGCDA
jgi:hypothetical protein